MKKIAGDIIILHMFTSPPLTTWKIKIMKKWKKCLEIYYHFKHRCTINENHMMYGSLDMVHNEQNFSPLTTQKIKISMYSSWDIDRQIDRWTIRQMVGWTVTASPKNSIQPIKHGKQMLGNFFFTFWFTDSFT